MQHPDHDPSASGPSLLSLILIGLLFFGGGGYFTWRSYDHGRAHDLSLEAEVQAKETGWQSFEFLTARSEPYVIRCELGPRPGSGTSVFGEVRLSRGEERLSFEGRPLGDLTTDGVAFQGRAGARFRLEVRLDRGAADRVQRVVVSLPYRVRAGHGISRSIALLISLGIAVLSSILSGAWLFRWWRARRAQRVESAAA